MTTSTRSEWLAAAGLVMLSLAPAAAGTFRLTELAGGGEVTAANARFFAMPLPVVLHIVAAIPYSMIGAFQFGSSLRRRYPAWHRAAGRLLLVCGAVVALSGLWMTLVYPWPAGDGAVLYVMRLVVGSMMVASLVVGIDAIRRRDFVAHGEWMMRAYAIAMGAGTQVLTHLPYAILVGKPGETGRWVMMGAGWLINMLVAEWIIRSRRRVAAEERAAALQRAALRRSTRGMAAATSSSAATAAPESAAVLTAHPAMGAPQGGR